MSACAGYRLRGVVTNLDMFLCCSQTHMWDAHLCMLSGGQMSSLNLRARFE